MLLVTHPITRGCDEFGEFVDLILGSNDRRNWIGKSVQELGVMFANLKTRGELSHNGHGAVMRRRATDAIFH